MPKKRAKARRVTKKKSFFSKLHPLKFLFSLVVLSALGVALFAGMNNGKNVLGSSTASCASQGGTCYGGYSCGSGFTQIGRPKDDSLCSNGVCCVKKTLKAPTSLSAKASCNNGISSMNFTWNKVSEANSYQLRCKLNSNSNYYPIIHAYVSNNAQIAIYGNFGCTEGPEGRNLPPNSRIYWYVTASNDYSISPNSVTASALTKTCPKPTLNPCTAKLSSGKYLSGGACGNDMKTLFTCNGKGASTESKTCSKGCKVNNGKADACK